MPSKIIYKEEIVRDIATAWQCSDEADLRYMAENMSVRRFKKNELIYREGKKPNRLLYLVRGKVKIVKECSVGRTQIVRAVREQHFIGCRAFFAHENYTTSAMAFEDSMIAIFPIEVLERMMAKNTGVLKYFLYELAVIVGNSDDHIVSYTQKHIRGRLADAILGLKNKYGVESDGATLSITMSRDDIASMSNMSTSNAIRTLSAFVQEKVVTIERKKIKILDEEGLKKISQMG